MIWYRQQYHLYIVDMFFVCVDGLDILPDPPSESYQYFSRKRKEMRETFIEISIIV